MASAGSDGQAVALLSAARQPASACLGLNAFDVPVTPARQPHTTHVTRVLRQLTGG